MNFDHNHNEGTKSLVAGFCKKCNQMFYRDGDLASFSSAYSTPSYKTDVSLENIQNYREWLLYGGDFCDDCIPPMPESVRKDVILENQRRKDDLEDYILHKDDKIDRNPQNNKINKKIKNCFRRNK